jgi:hypothetical protein
MPRPVNSTCMVMIRAGDDDDEEDRDVPESKIVQVTAGSTDGKLKWTAKKHCVGGMEDRVLVLDFEYEHLIFETPAGLVMTSTSLHTFEPCEN